MLLCVVSLFSRHYPPPRRSGNNNSSTYRMHYYYYDYYYADEIVHSPTNKELVVLIGRIACV
jgi:hypothetical protein